MKSDDIYTQLKEAEAETGLAYREMIKHSIDNGRYRRFIEARQRYWELSERCLEESREVGEIQDLPVIRSTGWLESA